MTLTVKPKYPRWLPAPFRLGFRLSQTINKTVSQLLSPSQIQQLDGVDGQLSISQGAVLFYLAYTLPPPGRIVEIGSFKGKSTSWLASALQLGKTDEKLLAIDPHLEANKQGVVGHNSQPGSHEAFLENLLRLKLTPYVQPVRKTSQDAAQGWNEPLKLLFIDGSHLYPDVLTDLRLWEPWLKIGGVICMHDTRANGSHPGVPRAMNEYIVAAKRFKELLRLGNMAVFRKLS